MINFIIYKSIKKQSKKFLGLFFVWARGFYFVFDFHNTQALGIEDILNTSALTKKVGLKPFQQHRLCEVEV